MKVCYWGGSVVWFQSRGVGERHGEGVDGYVVVAMGEDKEGDVDTGTCI